MTRCRRNEVYPSERPLQMLATASVLLAVTPFTASAEHEVSLIEAWNASDEASDESSDHSPWQQILDSYL